MSSCRFGVNPYVHRWNDQVPHEPRKFPYERREYKVLYSDGTSVTEAYNAYAKEHGDYFFREVVGFEVDGVRYAPTVERHE